MASRRLYRRFIVSYRYRSVGQPMHPLARHFCRSSGTNTPAIHLFSRQCTALSLSVSLSLQLSIFLSVSLFLFLYPPLSLSEGNSVKTLFLEMARTEHGTIETIEFVGKITKRNRRRCPMTSIFFVLTSSSSLPLKKAKKMSISRRSFESNGI